MEREAPETMAIAELAERAGTTHRTIRYYVSEGLLPPPGGRGQRRVYTADHLLRLQAIQQLKKAFLPLREIRRRMATMTADEMLRLANPSTEDVPSDRLARIAPLLTGGSSSGPVPMEAAPGRGVPYVASRLDHAIYRPIPSTQHGLRRTGPSGATESSTSDLAATADEVWHRVTLAPGVELHFRPSRDRRRDEAIAHLIRAATSLLATAPLPPE